MPAYFDKGLMVGQSAWHRGGTVIPEDDPRRFNVNDCIDLADMDDTILMGRAFYVLDDELDENGEAACGEVEGTRISLRKYSDGTIVSLGPVGKLFQEFQPREQFEWLQPWLDTKEVAIETAGTLDGGKIDWVMAKILRDPLMIGGFDEVTKYLLISNGHACNHPLQVGFTPTRVVCWNTLRAAQNNAASKLLKIRHTKNLHNALSTIRETIDLVDQQFTATGAQYQRMIENKVSLSDIRKYVKMVNNVDPDAADDDIGGKVRNRIDDMVNMALNGLGQDPSELTSWSAYNGVTQYLSHKYGADNDKRLKSMMWGTAADMGRRAYDLALQMAG